MGFLPLHRNPNSLDQAGSRTRHDDIGGHLHRRPDARVRRLAAVWTAGLSSVLARMSRAAPVLVVHPTPRFRTWTLASCAAYKVMFNPMSCAGTTSRSVIDGWRRRAVLSEAAAVARNPATAALELTDTLCPLPTCSVARGETWLFRDGAHLSVPGALTLSGPFQAAIEKYARPTDPERQLN